MSAETLESHPPGFDRIVEDTFEDLPEPIDRKCKTNEQQALLKYYLRHGGIEEICFHLVRLPPKWFDSTVEELFSQYI